MERGLSDRSRTAACSQRRSCRVLVSRTRTATVRGDCLPMARRSDFLPRCAAVIADVMGLGVGRQGAYYTVFDYAGSRVGFAPSL